MIESLKLIGFQSHGRREIQFSPSVTTIIGNNDVGKSAVLRALRWVCMNQPSGEEFIRKGDDFAKVILKVDGQRIIRTRGAGKNLYQLNKEKPFSAFGLEVPRQIAELLNLCPENFQDQHDAPFWFSLSPGQVSKNLNQIVDLGSIDTSLANIAGTIRKLRSEESVSRGRLASANESFKSLQWVTNFRKDLKKLESLETSVESRNRETVSLMRLLNQTVFAQQTVKDAAEREAEGSTLTKTGEKLKDYSQKTVELRGIIGDISHQRSIIDREIPSLDKIDKTRKNLEKVSFRRQGLSDLLDLIKRTETKVKTSTSQLEYTQTVLKTTTKGERCPVCEKPL